MFLLHRKLVLMGKMDLGQIMHTEVHPLYLGEIWGQVHSK